MVNIFITSLIAIFVSNSPFSQDTIQSKNSIVLSMNAEMSKLDFFHNIQVNTELYNLLSLEASVGVNVNKTYFQRSFAPQFSIGIGYDLLKSKNRWKLIPMIKSRTTMIDLSESSRLRYLEGSVGYSLAYGEKWYVTQGAFIGRGKEWYNTIDSQVNYWAYSFYFGFGYEF
ncbi:MAG: hypothetical protein COA32_07085 [Fluviicola sp.]|nr:MAG: hypothetical protein COA32_07085 [Fluviicola sp.]